MALFCGIPALRGRWEFRGTLQSRRRPDGESRPAEAEKFGNEGLMSEQVDNLQSNRPVVVGIPDALRDLLHQREAVCAELEQLPSKVVEDYPAEIGRLTAAFHALPLPPPEYAEILDKRFAEAVQAAETAAAENEAKLKARAAKLEAAAAVTGELDALIAAGDLATLGEAEALERKWNDIVNAVGADAVDAAGFEAKFRPLKEKLDAEAAADREKAEKALKLAEEFTALTAGEDMNLLHDRKNEIEIEYAALGRVPKQAADRYVDALHKAAARLAMHYETLDLARWESYTHKLDLCAELDKLNAVPDSELPKAARALHELREKWKNLGGVPKVKNEEINTRYLEATRALQHRVDEYFAQRRQEQKQAALTKQGLCEQAAKLADSTEWNVTSEAFKTLQAAWKTIPHAGAAEKTLYANFRASADKFFGARSAYFDERNRKFDAIAEKKRALIAEAETLAEQSGEQAVRRAKQLRAEYQSAGAAGRAEPELAAKFNAAMDKFFSGCREAFAGRENRSRELIAELEQLGTAISEPGAAEKRYHEIQRELRELACRRTFDQEKKACARFEQALSGARKRVLVDKLTLAKTVARPLAAAFSALKRGETVDEASLAVEHLDRFGKLNSAAQLLKSAIAGDAKALEKLEKQAVAAEADQNRICSELEKLVGVKQEPEEAAPALDLAAELQAAIAGNFAKSSARAVEKVVDPKQLLSEYLNTGLVDAETLERSFERFDNAYGKLR